MGASKLYILNISILVLLIFLVYSKSIHGEFIWDDKKLILQDSKVQNNDEFFHIFTAPLGPSEGGKHSAYYRPVITLSYFLNLKITPARALSFHIMNIIVHTLVSICIYALMQLLAKRPGISFFTSLLFALHPAHVSSVSWISGRTDILCALFLIASLILYIKGAYLSGKSSLKRYSLISFALALGSKELAVMFPLLLFITDIHLSGWSLNKALKKVNNRFYLFVLIEAIAFIALHRFITGGAGESLASLSFTDQALRAITNLARYIMIVFTPFNLKFFYFLPKEAGNVSLVFTFTVVLLSLLLLFIMRGNKTILFGALLSIIFLLPVIGLIPISSGYAAADHLSYLPVLGGIIILSAILDLLLCKVANANISKLLFIFITFCVAFAFSIESHRNTMYWNSDVSLFTYLSEESPSDLTFNLLGSVFIEDKRIDKAEAAFMKSISFNDDNWEAWFGLSQVAIQRNDFTEAERYLKKAEKADNSHAEIYNNLGNIYFIAKDFSRAKDSYIRSIDLNPLNYEALYNLGNVYMITGNKVEAFKYFNRFILIAPSTFEQQKNRLKSMSFVDRLSENRQ